MKDMMLIWEMFLFHTLVCIYQEKILILLKQRLKDNGTKYYDEPYLRFKGTKYEQETFFVKDPNENILEIKTLTANPE
jgi:extradiol dioxygenase family protein